MNADLSRKLVAEELTKAIKHIDSAFLQDGDVQTMTTPQWFRLESLLESLQELHNDLV